MSLYRIEYYEIKFSYIISQYTLPPYYYFFVDYIIAYFYTKVKKFILIFKIIFIFVDFGKDL